MRQRRSPRARKAHGEDPGRGRHGAAGEGLTRRPLPCWGWARVRGTSTAVGVEAGRAQYQGLRFEIGDAEQALPFAERDFGIVFSRGISHLRRAELFTDQSFRTARNLMRYVRPGGLLLVSHHTKRDGSRPARHAQHPVSDLVKVFESAGDVFKVEVVDDFVEIGVQHADAPRPQARPVSAARRLGDDLVPRARSAARRRLGAVIR